MTVPREAPRPLQPGALRPGEDPELILDEGLGYRAGLFLITPEMGVATGYNSNVYAERRDRRGDFVSVLSPGLEAKADWGTNSLKIDANVEQSLFARYGREDITNANLTVDGKFGVVPGGELTALAQIYQAYEARTSPNDARGSEPGLYYGMTADLGYAQRFNRVSTLAEVRTDRYLFQDVPSSEGPIDQGDRDRNEIRARLRTTYEFIPETAGLFVEGRVRRTDYLRALTRQGYNRDSWGYEGIAGLSFGLPDLLKGELFGGLLTDVFDDDRFGTHSAPTFGGSVEWNPTLLTTVRGFLATTLEDSTFAGSSGYLARTGAITVDHELRRDIGLFTTAYVSSQAYYNIDRDDVVANIAIGANYHFERHLTFTPKLELNRRTSNIDEANYNQVIAMLRLNAKF